MKKTIIAAVLLSACTATNKYKGPNFTFDELAHRTNIPPVEYATSIQSSDGVIVKSCSEAHSVHSPLIWLPVIGPGLDLLMAPSVSELTWHDAWLWLPLIGPPISYVHGSQYCVYRNLDVRKNALSNQSTNERLHPNLEDIVSSEVVKEAITVSDQNCTNYQYILTAGFKELDANQKFLSDAATMTQTGASFANPIAGAIIGGLKQTVTSANDAIKTSFFVNK